MEKCPNCGSTNPDDTLQCECGYVFPFGTTIEEKAASISKKISILSKDLEWYRTELNALQKQVEQLKHEKYQPTVQQDTVQPRKEKEEVIEIRKEPLVVKIPESVIVSKPQQTVTPPSQTQKPKPSFSLEEYIGGNIINKIGIAILIIGIAIGVKYASDAGLISPLTRIVFGYLAGAGILATAVKLKKKYEGFSAVILSGGMATLYFTTLFAYSRYGLIPQAVAFTVMIIFTAFTVFAATVYNRQEIGIFGLVGAYGVPFLLGGGSGRVGNLFSYMTIINIGILVLSFKKYWNILNYVTFSLSWIIFCIWFFLEYNSAQHQTIAIVFSSCFFIIFYLDFMVYKIISKENLNAKDLVLLLLNSFVYFSIGCVIFNRINDGIYLGLFTLANAVIHLFFSYAVYKDKKIDRKLFYLLMGLVICFVTIAIPIQINGNWVTLFWAAEIIVLFWVGRIKKVEFYEWLAFTMLLPGVFSLIQDWVNAYFKIKTLHPFFNITFLTSLMMVCSLAGVIYLNKKKPLLSEGYSRFALSRIVNYPIPIVLFLITYFTFYYEISHFWLQRYRSSSVALDTYTLFDEDLLQFRRLWLLNYTALFMSAFSFLSIRKMKYSSVAWSSLCLATLTVTLILSLGLSDLSTLRSHYLSGYNSEYFYQGKWYIYFRYVCFTFLSVLMYHMYLLSKMDLLNKSVLKISPTALNLFILIALSSELTNIMVINHSKDVVRYEILSHKVGYTVLWGIYSLSMIAFGIWKKKKWIRIPAIVLFGIALIKLLIYDISGLATGYKVIAFVALGVLLLIVSFLYQKFKNIILSSDE